MASPSKKSSGLVVGVPSLRTIQPSPVGWPREWAWRILLPATAEVAKSSRIGQPLGLGKPAPMGLVPMRGASPPWGVTRIPRACALTYTRPTSPAAATISG